MWLYNIASRILGELYNGQDEQRAEAVVDSLCHAVGVRDRDGPGYACEGT